MKELTALEHLAYMILQAESIAEGYDAGTR